MTSSSNKFARFPEDPSKISHTEKLARLEKLSVDEGDSSLWAFCQEFKKTRAIGTSITQYQAAQLDHFYRMHFPGGWGK